MISPILHSSDVKRIKVKIPSMPTNPSFKPNNDDSYISKVIPINIFQPSERRSLSDVKVSIEPIILFGKSMSSSNPNIVFHNETYMKFILNTQNLKDQGIMLANIKLTDTTVNSKDTVTSSVHYSVPNNSGAINPSMVNYVDSSIYYNSTEFPSLHPDYTFMSSTYSISNFFENGDVNDYKATKSKDGNNFNFLNATNNNSTKSSNNKKIIEIVIPIVVAILLLMILLFLAKNNKNKTNSSLKKTKKIYN